jgi:hypothetical protein
MSILELRQDYHQHICQNIIRITPNKLNGYPNFADGNSKASTQIAWGIVERIGCLGTGTEIRGQTSGGRFESITKDFLEKSFGLLQPLRPGRWQYSMQHPISFFDQYAHLANLEKIVEGNSELACALGTDYIITPDIVIGRWAVSDQDVNQETTVVNPEDAVAKLTPLREVNFNAPRAILHASISCKWTLRSDRSQNARTEGLNLVRNRKGNLPHIVAVTAEPLPTRIASLALGTGDLDCVYHFALTELRDALLELGNEDQMDMLTILIEGRRLRDISDLPFDLAI